MNNAFNIIKCIVSYKNLTNTHNAHNIIKYIGQIFM